MVRRTQDQLYTVSICLRHIADCFQTYIVCRHDEVFAAFVLLEVQRSGAVPAVNALPVIIRLRKLRNVYFLSGLRLLIRIGTVQQANVIGYGIFLRGVLRRKLDKGFRSVRSYLCDEIAVAAPSGKVIILPLRSHRAYGLADSRRDREFILCSVIPRIGADQERVAVIIRISIDFQRLGRHRKDVLGQIHLRSIPAAEAPAIVERQLIHVSQPYRLSVESLVITCNLSVQIVDDIQLLL